MMNKIKLSIVLGVCAAHIATIGFLASHKKMLPAIKSFRPLTVHTTREITPAPPKIITAGKKFDLTPKVDEALLKNLEKSLQSFSGPAPSFEAEVTPLLHPAKIALNLDRQPAFNDGQSCKERLSRELKNMLRLPEFGTVSVSFCVNKEGKISNVMIMESQSQKNQQYLKKTLPELSFPWFNQYISETEAHDFTIVFKNET